MFFRDLVFDFEYFESRKRALRSLPGFEFAWREKKYRFSRNLSYQLSKQNISKNEVILAMKGVSIWNSLQNSDLQQSQS